MFLLQTPKTRLFAPSTGFQMQGRQTTRPITPSSGPAFQIQRSQTIRFITSVPVLTMQTPLNMKTITPSQKPEYEDSKFQCKVCGKALRNQGGLSKHLKVVHKIEILLTCEECRKLFAQSSNLRKHIMLHTGKKTFTCDVCGKLFVDNCKLQRRMVTHTDERAYECKSCGQTFNRKDNLTNKHSRTNTGQKSYECNPCMIS